MGNGSSTSEKYSQPAWLADAIQNAPRRRSGRATTTPRRDRGSGSLLGRAGRRTLLPTDADTDTPPTSLRIADEPPPDPNLDVTEPADVPAAELAEERPAELGEERPAQPAEVNLAAGPVVAVAEEATDEAAGASTSRETGTGSGGRLSRMGRKEAARRQRRRVMARVLVSTAVITGTAFSGTAIAMAKTVTIVVDGETRRITTLSPTVDGALAAAGIEVAPYDALSPAAGSSISDGSDIVINRAQRVTIEVDGTSQDLWTTAGTVDDLLANRSVTLGEHDVVTPRRTQPLTDNTVVRVQRIGKTTETVRAPLPASGPTTEYSKDLDKGVQQTRPAAPGVEEITYRVITVDGKVTDRNEISRAVVEPATPEVVIVGQRVPPPPPPTTTTAPPTTTTPKPQEPKTQRVGNRVFFNDFSFGVNWDGLAKCESTNNPRAVNPSGKYRGMFQFDLPTWRSVGGTGDPIDASPEEQLKRAKLLYQARGLQPWACAWAAR